MNSKTAVPACAGSVTRKVKATPALIRQYVMSVLLVYPTRRNSDRVDPIAIRIAAFGEGLTLVGAIPGDISVYIITSAIGEGRHVLLVATGPEKLQTSNAVGTESLV